MGCMRISIAEMLTPAGLGSSGILKSRCCVCGSGDEPTSAEEFISDTVQRLSQIVETHFSFSFS